MADSSFNETYCSNNLSTQLSILDSNEFTSPLKKNSTQT